MSDLFKTQMQETGRASTLGMSLAEVVEDVVDLGIDAHRVVLNGAQAVLLGNAAKCSGYCVGTEKASTLVEDLACPVHGVAAQEKAKHLYPDRQAWLDALGAANSHERPA